MRFFKSTIGLIVVLFGAVVCRGQSPVAPAEASPAVNVSQENPLFDKFTSLLTGATLRGQFTVDGRPMNDLKEEAYTIEKVEKLSDGDMWIITSRIKYGDKDLTVPVPLEVKWAGKTPVLTMDNMTIPGLGTFSTRVVLHGDKYAGTWQHDAVGGHMFGKIELAATTQSEASK
jgi:hypothetical protein